MDENSVAIGYNATAPFKNSIVLGTEKDTVYIPGNLIIGKTTAVGVRAVSDGRSYPLYAYTHRSHDGDDRHFTDIVDVIERNHADDYKGSGDFAVAMVGSRTPGIQLGPYTFRTHAWSSGYNDNQKYVRQLILGIGIAYQEENVVMLIKVLIMYGFGQMPD